MKSSSFRLWALFPSERELAAAVRQLDSAGARVEEIYGPYPLPGGLESTGQQRTRLPWICFSLGLLGGGFKILFQYWTSAYDWPLNVGGKPWDSLPAFVPVTFEVMVLVAGLGAFAVFLGRRRMYFGRSPRNPYPETTDTAFALRVELAGGGGELTRTALVLREAGALRVDPDPGGRKG